MQKRSGLLLALLVGATSQAGEPPRVSGDPLAFESSELTGLAGTWGEPFRALMLMPGVSHIVSGASLPVVRGAAPSSTGFYLDGVRVPQPQHLWVGPASVSPRARLRVRLPPGARARALRPCAGRHRERPTPAPEH